MKHEIEIDMNGEEFVTEMKRRIRMGGEPRFLTIGRYHINVKDIVAVVPVQSDRMAICPEYHVHLRQGAAIAAVKLNNEETAMIREWMQNNSEVLVKPTKIE